MRIGTRRVLLAGLVVATAGTLVAALLGGTHPAPPVADRPAACAASAEAQGMVAIAAIELPIAGPVETAEAGAGPAAVDRVGYCLELTRGERTSWVFAAHQATGRASDSGLPLAAGQITRQRAEQLTVETSTGLSSTGTGWLEMWPNDTVSVASRQVPGSYRGDVFSRDEVHDSDDSPSASGRSGSFQVHDLSDGHTVLAVNGWAGTETLGLGIGDRPVADTDWTGAANAAQYSTRRLTFYARAAPVVVMAAPQSEEVLIRDRPEARSAPARFTGTATGTSRLWVRSRSGDAVTETEVPVVAGAFDIEVAVPVRLAETDLELWATVDGTDRLVRRVAGLLAGDLIVVHGQSNATAAQWGGSGHAAESPWVRTIGSSSPDPTISLADRAWYRARADPASGAAAIGQWPMRMAADLASRRQVPLAVVNGSHPGRPIDFFQRVATDPGAATSNYGRLLQRLQVGGIDQRVSALFWVQGESDDDDAVTHVRGVRSLMAGLRQDLAAPGGGDPALFLVQVRRSPCGNWHRVELRDAQRALGAELGATVIGLNGLDAGIGCHFDYRGGYADLGDWAARSVEMRLGERSPAGVRAADVRSARIAGPRRIELELAHADPLTIEEGAGDGFAIDGARVVGVQQQGRRLVLTLDAEVVAGSRLEYVGYSQRGAWIRNGMGMGLLTFSLPLR